MSCTLSLVSGGDTRYNDVRALVWTLPLDGKWASEGTTYVEDIASMRHGLAGTCC